MCGGGGRREWSLEEKTRCSGGAGGGGGRECVCCGRREVVPAAVAVNSIPTVVVILHGDQSGTCSCLQGRCLLGRLLVQGIRHGAVQVQGGRRLEVNRSDWSCCSASCRAVRGLFENGAERAGQSDSELEPKEEAGRAWGSSNGQLADGGVREGVSCA